jgi:uncharacterized tellurite resistance protein B-like protein
MELSELKGYLETEKSKKIIKLLSKIMKSEGKNELYQTITIMRVVMLVIISHLTRNVGQLRFHQQYQVI